MDGSRAETQVDRQQLQEQALQSARESIGGTLVEELETELDRFIHEFREWFSASGRAFDNGRSAQSDAEVIEHSNLYIEAQAHFLKHWKVLDRAQKLNYIRLFYRQGKNLFRLQNITSEPDGDRKPRKLDADVRMMHSVLHAMEFDPEMIDMVLEEIDDPTHQNILYTYAFIADRMEEYADVMYEKYARKTRSMPIAHGRYFLDPDMFYWGPLIWVHGILKDYYRTPKEKRDRQKTLKTIRSRTLNEAVAFTFFDKVSDALVQDTLNLKKYIEIQSWILETIKDVQSGSVVLETLHTKGKLAPIPEIFWRVDRTAEEYRERFGFDMTEFLQAFSDSKRQQIILELGPGNGTFRQERSGSIEGYADFAIADKLYYPLNRLIKNLIDFSSFNLTPEQEDLMADFLYKLMVIKSGQAGAANFEYDEEILERLKADPNSIIASLKSKVHLLKDTQSVPAGGNIASQGIAYEDQIKRLEDPEFNQACQALADHLEDYLRPVENIYDYLPAYSPGTIIGDFSDVKKLKDHQIDVGLAVRSTVFKEGDEYIKLMTDMTSKISEDGFYIDDSVRENFGRRYRLSELSQVQEDTSYPLHVIVGPGMQGEDYKKGYPVPLAVVMTKSEEKLAYVQTHLADGYEIKTLDEVWENVTDLDQISANGFSKHTNVA